VAGHDGRLLGENDLEAPRFQAGAVQLPSVQQGSGWGRYDSMAECVLSTGVEGQAGFGLALDDTGDVRQRSVVVGMAMAEDQRVRCGRIHLEGLVVIEEVLLGQAEVEQDLSPLRTAHRLEMIGEAVLGEDRSLTPKQRPALNRDRVEFATLGEDIVDVVHDVGHDEAIHRRH
jgi:hypothetical protein